MGNSASAARELPTVAASPGTVRVAYLYKSSPAVPLVLTVSPRAAESVRIPPKRRVALPPPTRARPRSSTHKAAPGGR